VGNILRGKGGKVKHFFKLHFRVAAALTNPFLAGIILRGGIGMLL
jgi:hypothetical protein